MKIKYLIISLLLIKNCYADNSFPLWFLTIIPTTVPTTYTNDIIRHTSVSKEKQNKKDIAEFIEQSYDKLEIEIAKGEGLYLDQLIELTKFEDREKKIESYRKKLNYLIKFYGTINNEANKKDKVTKFIDFILSKEQ